jgi:hypothetical protein
MSFTIVSGRTDWAVSGSHSWRLTPRITMGWPFTRIVPSRVSTSRKPTRQGTMPSERPAASSRVSRSA